MEHNKEKHLGTMRFDYNDGGICNRWFPYQNLSKEDIEEIQPKVNEIMFDRFKTFGDVIKECCGESYDKTKLLEEETANFKYAIKLQPVKGDYNGYIFVYRK